MIKYLRIECNEYHDTYRQDDFHVKEVTLEEIVSQHSRELEEFGWTSPETNKMKGSAEYDEQMYVVDKIWLSKLDSYSLSGLVDYDRVICRIAKPESVLTGELLKDYNKKVNRKKSLEKAKLKKKQDAAKKKKERELAKAKKLLQEEGLIA
jgi:hypothetical protein